LIYISHTAPALARNMRLMAVIKGSETCTTAEISTAFSRSQSPALFVLRLTKIKMDILIRKLTCRVFTQPRAIVLKIPFRRWSICWKTYGRGIQKIGWGTSQSGDGTACEVLNRSEMLLSGDVPSD
jgi:hypothetical protein